MLEQLVGAGMDVARLNFSHGSLDEHAERIRNLRAAGEKAGRHLGILMDIQGPKIRVGDIEGGSYELIEGEIVTLTADRERSTPSCIYVA